MKTFIRLILGSMLAGCSIMPTNPNASVFDAGKYECRRVDNKTIICERIYD